MFPNSIHDMLKNNVDETMDNQHLSSCTEKLEKDQRLIELPQVESDDFVVCMICGIKKRRLWKHLSDTHKISSSDYLLLYPTAKIQTESDKSVLQKGRNKFLGSLSKEQKSELLDEANKSLYRNKEALVKRAKNAWETIKADSEHYSKVCRSRSEGIKKSRELNPEAWKRRDEISSLVCSNYAKSNPDWKKNVGMKRAKLYWDRYYSDSEFKIEQDSKRSCSMKSNWAKTPFFDRLRRLGFIKGYKKFLLNGRTYSCRSLMEAKFMRFLDENDIRYKYEPFRWCINGRVHIPDFFISAYNLIIELKSTYHLNYEFEKVENASKHSQGLGFTYLLVLDLLKDKNEFYSIVDSIGSSDTSGSYALVEHNDIVRPLKETLEMLKIKNFNNNIV
jgi:hypothetical protein